MGYLKENSRIKEDTAMGIVFSGMFAIGLVLFTKIQTSQHLTHILFGNVLGVSREELIQTAIIALIIFILLGLKRRDFLLYCFDPSHARVAGLSPKLLHYGLLTLLALTIFLLNRIHCYDASCWGDFGCSDAHCTWHHCANTDQSLR